MQKDWWKCIDAVVQSSNRLHSLFRSYPCFITNLLTVKADRISVALNISNISRTIAPEILSIFWQDRENW